MKSILDKHQLPLTLLLTLLIQIPMNVFSQNNIKTNHELNIEIKNQRIFVEAENAPLKAILDEVASKLKIKTHSIGSLNGKVTGSISNATIEDFLRQISISYAIKTDKGASDGKVVYLVPKGDIYLENNPGKIPKANKGVMEDFVEIAPDAVIKAAVEGLGRYVAAAIRDNPVLYGFRDANDIEDSSLDDPFRVYTIASKKIMESDTLTILGSLIEPTSQWFFPVMASDGRYRAILVVDSMNGTWKAVGFGSSGLANQVDHFKEQWGAIHSNKIKFVRVYGATSDFIILKQQKKEAIYPLVSAMKSLRLDQKNIALELYSPEEIFHALQVSVRKL